MSSASLVEAQATLAAYKAKRDAVLAAAESVSEGDHSHTNHQLAELERQIDRYSREVAQWQAHAAGAGDRRFSVATWSRG